MSIGVKAVFNFSATAAVATTWTLTASTSVAIGDVVVLATAMRGSASNSISAVLDNAGNSWLRAIETAVGGMQSGIWYAPVVSTTANFQISVLPGGGRSISARAAHVLVLTGVDVALPYDVSTGASRILALSTATTATLSTSAATGTADELLIVSGHQDAISSVTMVADTAWIIRGNAIDAAGASLNVKKHLWTRPADVPGVYQFSASLSNGGAARTRQILIAGFRPLPGGSASATATLAIAPGGTLVATIDGAAAASLSMNGSAAITAVGQLAGELALSLSAAAQPAGVAGLAAFAPAVSFLGNARAGSAAADASGAPSVASLLGGGWDRRLFRKILHAHQRRLQGEARALGEATDLGGTAEPGQLEALAAELAALRLAPARQMWRLQEQASWLARLERNLQTLQGLANRELREREAEELLLLAA